MLLVLFIFGDRFFGWELTGFFAYTTTTTTIKGILTSPVAPGDIITTTIVTHPSRTLWDWLDLIIIPAVLAAGVYFLNRAQRQRGQQTTKDREEERALQHYLDNMTELLLEKDLRISSTGSKVLRSVARAQTMTILPTLNSNRKASILRFLHEAGLIRKTTAQPIIDLSWADLSGADLSGAHLSEAHLSGANLSGANLREAYLDDADLSGAYLREANLNDAFLIGANLSGANLSRANLRGANLREANLNDAFLIGANLIGENLRGANLSGAHLSGANLSGAFYDDNTTFPADFDPVKEGAIKVTK